MEICIKIGSEMNVVERKRVKCHSLRVLLDVQELTFLITERKIRFYLEDFDGNFGIKAHLALQIEYIQYK